MALVGQPLPHIVAAVGVGGRAKPCAPVPVPATLVTSAARIGVASGTRPGVFLILTHIHVPIEPYPPPFPLSFPLLPIPLVQRKHAPILLKRHFGASALFLLVFDLAEIDCAVLSQLCVGEVSRSIDILKRFQVFQEVDLIELEKAR